MSQRQQFQQHSRAKFQSNTHVYTVCRAYNQSEWYLIQADPRTWSKSPKKALLFASIDEAQRCIIHHFPSAASDDAYVGRIRITN